MRLSTVVGQTHRAYFFQSDILYPAFSQVFRILSFCSGNIPDKSVTKIKIILK